MKGDHPLFNFDNPSTYQPHILLFMSKEWCRERVKCKEMLQEMSANLKNISPTSFFWISTNLISKCSKPNMRKLKTKQLVQISHHKASHGQQQPCQAKILCPKPTTPTIALNYRGIMKTWDFYFLVICHPLLPIFHHVKKNNNSPVLSWWYFIEIPKSVIYGGFWLSNLGFFF
jgi:hypothetical protein